MIVKLFEYGVPLRYYNATITRESFKTIPTELYIGFHSGRMFIENTLDLRLIAGKATIFERGDCVMADCTIIDYLPTGKLLNMMRDTMAIRPAMFGCVGANQILSAATINFLYASEMSEEEKKLKMIKDVIEAI